MNKIVSPKERFPRPPRFHGSTAIIRFDELKPATTMKIKGVDHSAFIIGYKEMAVFAPVGTTIGSGKQDTNRYYIGFIEQQKDKTMLVHANKGLRKMGVDGFIINEIPKTDINGKHGLAIGPFSYEMVKLFVESKFAMGSVVQPLYKAHLHYRVANRIL